MNEKQLAERLRQIDQGYFPGQELRRLADELDPPKPEPGTVVIRSDGAVGFVDDKATVYFHNGRGMRWDNLGTQWKPARILGPRQVAVDVPPVSEWGHKTTDIEIRLHWWDQQRSQGSERVRLITRAEAMRMEASDEN